tara:strand:+ start:490 stop:870 length:381 start_codon:yes stop_codon:yes gene_type:complete
MKNTILLAAIAVLFGAGLMSCSMVEGTMMEGPMVEAETSFLGGIFSTIMGLLKGFLPSLGLWEGVVTMFSPRKRKHYAKAIKAIVPTDKNMDFGGAVGSVAAALGVSHSTENSKMAFEEDEDEELV